MLQVSTRTGEYIAHAMDAIRIGESPYDLIKHRWSESALCKIDTLHLASPFISGNYRI